MEYIATTIFGYTIATIWLVMLTVAWVVIALLPANIASKKGHGFWGWFFLSLFFWWITLFVALFMHDKSQQPPTSPAAPTPPPAQQ